MVLSFTWHKSAPKFFQDLQGMATDMRLGERLEALLLMALAHFKSIFAFAHEEHLHGEQ